MKIGEPILTVLVLLALPLVVAQDSDQDGIPDENESLLAERFAPVLRFVSTEVYFPIEISYAIGNSELKQIVGDGEAVLYTNPTVMQIAAFTDNGTKHFLDNVHGGIDDRGVEQNFISTREDLEPTVYARVTAESTYTVVQYWFYYPFNDGPLNSHEGDWEMIQVTLEDGNPLSASYSQHFYGQTADWEDVLKRDEHPVVYVARGSHANYFRSYQGVLGVQSDEVSNNGPILDPDDYQLVLLGELSVHPPGDAWLKFAGRWGEWGEDEDALRGRRGPPGPAHGDNAAKWESPVGWELELNMLHTRWLWLSWLVANFAILFVIYLVLRGAWTLFGLGRSVWNRDVFGGIGLGSTMAITGAIIAILAIWQPWYYLTLNIAEGNYSTEGEVTILRMDGINGLQ
ncbi:MAG: Vps62-related protein, partial [Theionarchaea archaeon]|nr:Vps62-related protein [Theionarchaea archaeon]